MKAKLHSILFILLCVKVGFGQTSSIPNHPVLPQAQLNAIGKQYKTVPPKESLRTNQASANATKPKDSGSAFQAINKINEVKNTDYSKYAHGSYSGERVLDTMYVGLVPHDTVWITGSSTHDGPIYVFNDGVLIFYFADFVNTNGDLIVFQNGTVLGLNSNLTFPQSYFYQRSLIAVQHSTAYFENCNFNYSGVQHSLVVGDSAQVGMQNVHQMDWTTAGLFGAGSFWAHGMNLGGEYILSDSSTTYFNHVDTLLLWHKMPNTANINYSFPAGASVYGYYFANTVPGVSGIDYETYVDSCQTVWWGMMPTNGSDVTISNSVVRAVGAWFEHGDTANVDGIYDDSLYVNTVMPLTDRNLHMINTYVQTFSLYVFDSSQITLQNSAVGEVGTQQHSSVLSQQFLLDGSGGYFWATDSSFTYATDVVVYSTARSEKYGTFLLQYSTLYFSVPTSVHNSLFISVQNSLPADPLPYDASAMWMENIETPSLTHADSLVPVVGSVWIDQGPMGNPVDFTKYSLYYQLVGASSWTAIVVDSMQEIRHNTLGVWNTTALTAGNYLLRLVGYDNFNDSIEDYKFVVVQAPVATGIDEVQGLMVSTYPNPANEELNVYLSENNAGAVITVYNALGQLQRSVQTNDKNIRLDLSTLASGVYFIETRSGEKLNRQRFIKK